MKHFSAFSQNMLEIFKYPLLSHSGSCPHFPILCISVTAMSAMALRCLATPRCPAPAARLARLLHYNQDGAPVIGTQQDTNDRYRRIEAAIRGASGAAADTIREASFVGTIIICTFSGIDCDAVR